MNFECEILYREENEQAVLELFRMLVDPQKRLSEKDLVSYLYEIMDLYLDARRFRVTTDVPDSSVYCLNALRAKIIISFKMENVEEGIW